MNEPISSHNSNFLSTLNELRKYCETFCPNTKVSDVQSYISHISEIENLSSTDGLRPIHLKFRREIVEVARKVYKYAQSQTFSNVFNKYLDNAAEILTVEVISTNILPEALKNYDELCKKHEDQNWEKLKCSDIAFLWKGVNNVEYELGLMEDFAHLNKNENFVETLKQLASMPIFITRLKQLSTIINMFNVPSVEDEWLTKSQSGLQDNTLTLGKLNQLYGHLNSHLDKIDEDCWSFIKELSEAGDLLELLKSFDIKNLIN